jgi:hypothetical protein
VNIFLADREDFGREWTSSASHVVGPIRERNWKLMAGLVGVDSGPAIILKNVGVKTLNRYVQVNMD